MSKQNTERECLHCKVNNENKESDLWFMVAVERPYANLWFHRECYNKYNYEELVNFCQKNLVLWYN